MAAGWPAFDWYRIYRRWQAPRGTRRDWHTQENRRRGRQEVMVLTWDHGNLVAMVLHDGDDRLRAVFFPATVC